MVDNKHIATRLPDEIIQKIEVYMKENNYVTISDFLRDAIREKIDKTNYAQARKDLVKEVLAELKETIE